MTVYRCQHLWRPEGWLSPGYVAVDASGFVSSVGDAPPSVQSVPLDGYVVPGMPNVHSHAFQRAMAGLAEHASGGEDSFWSWRKAMYGFLERLGPEDVEAIAAELYVEMLEHGTTAVGEFHYLHHAANGEPYDNPAEMSERLLAAAHRAGIGLTLLPALYAASGFGGAPPQAAQQRFASDVDWLTRLVERLSGAWRGDPEVRIGVAPHSLRAVPPDALAACVRATTALDPHAPVHIHVAEQMKEVDDCLRSRNARPVEWLLGQLPVDARWCLVHATHVTAAEIDAIARSGAVVGLCPTTEANLGDGIAPAAELLGAGVHVAIGTDSHVSVSPSEELRWLEYGQRLIRQRRNVLADKAGGSTGERLFAAALAGGAQALGRSIGSIAAGKRADLVVLDAAHPTLAGSPLDRMIDALVFSAHGNPVRAVMVGGRWVVQDGRHRDRDRVLAEYRRTLDRVAS